MKLFLLGMMGSGKSYWAQQVAAAIDIDWMDLDAEIEKESLMSIREIFETEGEVSFRRREQLALHALATVENIIVATGGGTPCFHNNIDWMNEKGITIWINDPVEILVQRLQKEKAHRPLISSLSDDELQQFLEKKLKERQSFYSKAKYVVEGYKSSVDDFVKLAEAVR